MNDVRPAVRRGSLVLRSDPSRVITKLFLPGQEVVTDGRSRADEVIHRVLAMSEQTVTTTLAATIDSFRGRHRDLVQIFDEHYRLVAHRMPDGSDPTQPHRTLIGAYFTQEYAVEAAALFNPSLVAHPDQRGLSTGETRFVMSVRAVGEGHISSIGFRSGVVGTNDDIRFDEAGHDLITGQTSPAPLSRDFLRSALAGRADADLARHILSLLPDPFDAADVESALASNTLDRLTRASSDAISDRIRQIAACNYEIEFPADRSLGDRVLFPTSPDESHGIEDARFTRFQNDDGSICYYGTCTAFDGTHVAPRLLQTTDFTTFHSMQLLGEAAKNKGMAMFPRKVRGSYLALSRWDRESIGVATSTDARTWSAAATIATPKSAWELIQLGNCGPPIETSDGWLVLTHGVGPVREYAIGAMLLDIDDPTIVLGTLNEPILTPLGEERDGYVPNVVYSCGALLHAQRLVLPYGCSDSSIRVAFLDVAELLKCLHETQ
jgi:predicted GH43/DUF377 family glycosyl hydrolase